MQFRTRQLAPNELDHELIWLVMSLGSLALAATWLRAGLLWPECLFHHLTGLPCVTCGMTRCAMAFFHGDFAMAIQWNPLIFLALCGLSIFDVYAFAVLVTRAPRLRMSFSQRAISSARVGVLSGLALNWIYLIAHSQRF